MPFFPIHSSRPTHDLGSRKLKSICSTGTIFCALLLLLTISVQAQILRSGSLGQGGLAASGAGISSAVAPISLLAVLPPSVGLSISNVHLEVPVKDPNVPSKVVSVPVTSTWHLGTSSTAVELVAYFDSPQHALADAEDHSIPSSRVLGGLSGEQLRPFTESSTVGSDGGSRILYHEGISRKNYTGSRNDTIEIGVDRVADISATAGVYEGILHLRMIAY